MIKYIIFDLDGVLVDARELHYQALNRALGKFGYNISRDEHLSTYDGLPTRKKLALLTKQKGLPTELYEDIWCEKQNQTREIIDKEFSYDERMRGILKDLKNKGYRLSVCSNSITESVKMMLLRKGLMEFIDFYLSNEDIELTKPHPAIFLKAMMKLGAKPKECMIIEDSHHGREAANASGAYLCGVKGVADVSMAKILKTIEEANTRENIQEFSPKWQGGNLTIIIPMAGEGKSFQRAGYTFPKPLVDIQGKPMIQWVVENINAEAKFIFIVKKDHYQKYNLKYLLQLIAPGCTIVQIKAATQGAVLSVLAAQQHINNNEPITIVNSDQFLEWNSNEFFYAMMADECDGGIVTFESAHPQWSYVSLGGNGYIKETAEKKPISNRATAGVYYFKHGQEFIKYARQMISQRIATNGEYYVCPVYNEFIKDNKKIRDFHIDKLWSFSTPEDVTEFHNYNAANATSSTLEKNGNRQKKPISLAPPSPIITTTTMTASIKQKIINIVIPMAGAGSRFTAAGYNTAKPFIDVAGLAMIERVLNNLFIQQANYILIARSDHLQKHSRQANLIKEKFGVTYLTLDTLTQGAACTVLAASQHINNDQPLLIANSDQIVDMKIIDMINDSDQRNLDGSILTFNSNHPKWSYVKTNSEGLVLAVREKQVISNHATVGIYYFSHGSDFISATGNMIANNDRTNNEFYVAPVYNYLISTKARIGIYEIDQAAMHGLGTPEDLKLYLSHLQRAPQKINSSVRL